MAQDASGNLEPLEEQLLNAVQIARNASELTSLLFAEIDDPESFFRIIKAECQRLAEIFCCDTVRFEIFDGSFSFPGVKFHWPDDRCVLGEDYFLSDETSYVRKMLESGDPFHFESPELLPYEALAEKDYFLDQGIRSAAMIPLIIHNRLRGAFTVEFTGKNHLWKQIEIDDLRILGNTFTSALLALENDQTIRKSEILHQSVIQSMNEGVIVHDRNMNIIAANESAARILKVPVEKLKASTGKNWEGRTIRPDDSLYTLEQQPAAVTIRTGETLREIPMGILDDRGKIICWISINSAPLYDHVSTDLIGAVVTFTDITREKVVQNELERANELLRLTVEGAKIGTWVYNVTTGQTTFNDQWTGMLGFEQGELAQNVSSWESRIHPEDRDRVLRIQNEHLVGKRNFQEFEHRLRHKDGHWVWVLSRGRVIKRSPEGLPVILAGTHLDISSLKQSEDSIRKNEQRVSLALSSTQMGIWEWDMVQDTFSVDDRWCEMLGYSKQEIGPGIDGWERLVHPDDVAGVWAKVDEYLKGKIPVYSAEYRMRHKDGHWLWIADKGIVTERAKDHTPLRSLGTHMDITPIKTAENQILENEERLALAVDASKIGIWDWNLETGECYFSPQFLSIAGIHCPRANPQMIDRFYDVVHPADRLTWATAVEEHLNTGNPLRVELRLMTPNHAEPIWCVIRAQAKRTTQNSPFRLVGALIEITQRKKAEEILAKEAQLTALRYQINPHFLFNTLNSIRACVPTDNREARDMISHLSEYLRYSLREGNRSFVTLRQEIHSLSHYLDIEKILFNEDLIIEKDIQPEAMDCLIAPLLVQPVVENAVKYGKKTNPNQLTIRILGWIEGGFLHIEVSNTGRWMDASETIESTHIGINNIMDRLSFLYGERATLRVREENGLVRVTMKIPASFSSSPSTP